MSILSKKKPVGFTIVELLIVIVVIAILAAITIVAYNGIQVRAENTKTIAAVNAHRKALTQYRIDNNGYPTNGGMCLGNTYPVLDGTTAGCRNSAAVLPNSVANTMVNALKPYMNNSFPMPSVKILSNTGGSRDYLGAYFYGSNYDLTLDGVEKVGLLYTIESDECPINPSYPSSGYPDFTSSNTGSYVTFGTGSICMLLLPRN